MRRIVLTICGSLVLSGAVAHADEYFTKHKEKKLGEPTEEMALVYVVRPQKIGFAIKFWTFYGDEFIGVTKGKTYTFGLVPEGTHLFWNKAENTDPIEMEVVGGRTYYLKQTVRMGFGKARGKLVPIDEAEGRAAIDKCDYIEPTEAGRQRAMEIASNRLERAQNKESKKEKWEGD